MATQESSTADASHAVQRPVKQHVCSSCGKRFGRLDHLRRHSLLHSNISKAVPCQICGKTFVRKDALQRHESIHFKGCNLLQKAARACIPCAVAKRRCTGNEPCTRCQQQDRICSYPAGSQKRVEDETSAQHSPSSNHDTPSSIPAPAQTNAPREVNLDYLDLSAWSELNWLGQRSPNDQSQLSSIQALPRQFMLTIDAVNHVDLPTPNLDGLIPAVEDYPPTQPVTLLSEASTSPNISNEAHTPITKRNKQDHGKRYVWEKAPDEHLPGQHYVDGQPARLTTVNRKKPRKAKDLRIDQASLSPQVAWQKYDLSCKEEVLVELPGSDIEIPTEDYEQMQTWFTQLCLQPHVASYEAFEVSAFPDARVLGHLVHLYFRYFDISLAIVHSNTLFSTSHTALLLLCISAIGSRYLDDGTASHNFASSMHQCLTRVLDSYVSPTNAHSHSDETLSMIRLLHAVNSAYSERPPDDNVVLTRAYYTAVANLSISPVGDWQHEVDLEQQWKRWLRREQSKRLAYAAWQLDYMWWYEFQIKPAFTLSNAAISLPCASNLWDAQSAEEWITRYETLSSDDCSLEAMLADLYIEKSITALNDDLWSILLIHGILRKSFEVGEYYSSPLSSYEPAEKPQRSADVLPKKPIWLPSVSGFARWRNSACDALDFLHWRANAAIGLARGMEDPVVLYLHLSRVILLAPHSTILSLAKALANGDVVSSIDRDLLSRWVSEDQFKCRLAVVHAGVTFWHIRRYSVSAFYEASAIGLATLTLWTFATFANHKHAQTHDCYCKTSDSIISLDRPTDDELVQDFIKNGATMQTHMSEVGDLYNVEAAIKILRRGCRMLRELNCWENSTSWLILLQKLRASYREPDTADHLADI